MQHKLIPLDDVLQWKAALDGIPHAFGHTWESCSAAFLTTKAPTYLYVFQSDSLRIICPISERRYGDYIDIFTPFGFSGFTGTGDFVGFPEEWKKFARWKGWVCGYLGLHPLLARPTFYSADEKYVQNELFFLDLKCSIAELYGRLSRSRKRQIKRWDARGDWLCVDRERLTNFIVANAAEFFASRRASETYAFPPETWKCWQARRMFMCLAHSAKANWWLQRLFGYAGSIAEALFNISLPKGRMPPLRSCGRGALHLESLGITMLNMGGGVRQGDSIAEAKHQFGAQVIPLCALKQVYDVDIFTTACRHAGKDPLDRGDFSLPIKRQDDFKMYQKSSAFYDLLYHFKNYDEMSAQVIDIIRQKHPAARTLLDVACGTGRHLEFLAKSYVAEGLDLNPDLLQQARKRCPSIPLHLGNMVSFDLKRRFDVIVILFSSIAYVKSAENFKHTIACIAKHLNPGGLVLIEPFFSVETFWTYTITANFVDRPDLKIIWMYTSERREKLAILDIHYMVGTPDGIEEFRELHELGLTDKSDYEVAFREAGLSIEYCAKGPCGRGLYTGMKLR